MDRPLRTAPSADADSHRPAHWPPRPPRPVVEPRATRPLKPVPKPRKRTRVWRWVVPGVIGAAAIQVVPEMLPAIARAKVAGEILASAPEPTLPVPVIGVRRQRLRDTWGAPRSQGRQHQGIDIVAPRGRPVVSTTRGIVRSVGTNRLGGQVVWVTGPGGRAHYYAHLDRYSSVRAGDIVQPGTVLGYVGDTGNAKGTTPHLHYGIYEPGSGPINPYPFLAARTDEPHGTSSEPARVRVPDNGRISVRPRVSASQ